MEDRSLHSAGFTFPARLVLAVDQFFKVMQFNGDVARFAYRHAYRDGITRGLQGAELSAYVARSAKALRTGDPTVRANATWAVLDETWSRWSRSDSALPVSRVSAGFEEKLLNASRWRSVSEIVGFPFASFPEMLSAVAAGRCYISVSSLGFRYTNVTHGYAARALDRLLSWVPFLVALVSIFASIGFKNAWMLVGIPAAVLALVVGAAPLSLVRSVLLSVQSDQSAPLPLRLLAKILQLLFSPIVGVVLTTALFAWMLSTDRQAGAWIVASYMMSLHAVRVFRARGTIALSSAVKKSEAFFLFALTENLCGLRDKTTGEFLWRPAGGETERSR
jgi:hypothetical protein